MDEEERLTLLQVFLLPLPPRSELTVPHLAGQGYYILPNGNTAQCQLGFLIFFWVLC